MFASSNNQSKPSIFGNSSTNQNQSQPSLFGNSNTSFSNPANTNTLFGNSSNNAANNFNTNSTSSFGGNSAAPTSLFGSNNNNNNVPNTGLFGNSNNNSNNTSSTGGLFGNSNSNANTNTSTGLFGGSAGTNTGGLFGNSSLNNPTSGSLFGGNNSNTNAGSNTNNGLFGGSSNTANSGGLFGAKPASGGLFSNNAASTSINPLSSSSGFSNQSNIATLDSNPYNYDRSFASNSTSMPKSLTESPKPFSVSLANKRKRRSSSVSSNASSYIQQRNKQPSLLSKLSQTFKFFKKQNENVQGLFTPSKSNITENIAPKTTFGDIKNAYKSMHTGKLQSLNPIIYSKPNGEVSDIKKLVIQTKPTQFHLIDADRVLVKRRRIMSSKPEFIESDNELSDEDEDNGKYASNEPPASKRKLVTPPPPPPTQEPQNNKEPNDNKEYKEKKHEIEIEVSKNIVSDGYWSSPSPKELSNYTIEELGNVENFIVGRVGYGQIAFRFPVDLTAFKDNLANSLFGDVVRFKPKHVQVYTGSTTKPPMGQGLNIPATIAVEKVFPDKGTSSSEFIKFLQSQRGTDFVTYDPITGNWVFKVNHFSIWGLVDDDDHEASELKRKQDDDEVNAEAEYKILERSGFLSKRSIEEEVEEHNFPLFENKIQKTGNGSAYIPGGWELNLNNTNDLMEKNDQMQIEIERQLVLLSWNNQSDITRDEEIEITRPLITKNSANEAFRNIAALPLDIDMDDVIDEKPFEPALNLSEISNIEVQANLAVSDDWDVQLELVNDVNSSLSPNVKDINGMKKISFGDVDKILFGDFDEAMEKQEKIETELRIDNPINFARWDSRGNLLVKRSGNNHSGVGEVSVKNMLTGPNSIGIAKVFAHLLSKAVILKRDNDFPEVQPSHQLSFEDLFVGFSNTSPDDEEKSVISLCSQLFDNDKIASSKFLREIQDGNEALKRKIGTAERRRLLANWMKRFNHDTIEKSLKKYSSDPLETIFIHLCANDLDKAILTAINSNNNHLSVLLTLLDSSDNSVKYAASRQLTTWKKSSALKMIPKPILKIYQLLSGNIYDPSAIIDIHENLPWNISLSLSLYYSSLSVSVQDIINGFKINTVTSKPSETDVYYNIMNLYAALIDSDYNLAEGLPLLKSERLSGKLQWLIFKILSKLADNSKRTNDIGDQLSLTFAEQLQLTGFWKEAIFVYTHLSNDNTAAHHITELVMQKIEDIKSSINEEKYLVSVLKIPRSLIFEAVALRYRSMGDHWNEASSLLDAKLWKEAHSTIITNVAPNAIINSGKALEDLENILQRFPHSGIIPEWSNGAGIYENYIKLLKLNDDSDGDQLLELLKSLITNLPLLKITNFNVRVSANIISKNVSEKVLDNFIQINPDKILSLPMGESEMNYYSERLSTVFLKQKILDL